MNPNNFTPKNANEFVCENCHFKCFKKCDWKRHIVTAKHFRLTNPNNFTPKNAGKIFSCECGKSYKHLSTLCTHKKKCNWHDKSVDDLNVKDKDNLLLHFIKKNEELQHKLIELMCEKNNTTTVSNNNSFNTNNTSFNLNFFLNETCKDAMNMTDFVSSIKVSLEDLEHTGRKGYIEGISNIIVKNLNKLEQHMRPLHCSDAKREVLYIKDNNEWTKESLEKPILTKAVKTIANENIKKIQQWIDKYPDCTQVESKKNNLYLKIVGNSMNGLTKEEGDKNIHRIISNIAKETVIQK